MHSAALPLLIIAVGCSSPSTRSAPPAPATPACELSGHWHIEVATAAGSACHGILGQVGLDRRRAIELAPGYDPPLAATFRRSAATVTVGLHPAKQCGGTLELSIQQGHSVYDLRAPFELAPGASSFSASGELSHFVDDGDGSACAQAASVSFAR